VRRPGDARFHRHWGTVTVAAAPGPLTISTTHLCADWGGVHRESTRLDEVAALLAAPSGDAIAADCNTRPGEAPWQALRAAGWRDAWLESGAAGDGLTSDTRRRIQRIDYLWLAPGSPWRAVAAEVLADEPIAVRGVEVLLSDHHPLLVELER
jgi:endonuclease/exonuclease/phosphatase (EEP) superfamily protein YafD